MSTLSLTQGSSSAATEAEVKEHVTWLASNGYVAFYTFYVGAGSPRFSLPTVPELQNSNFGQVIVMTRGIEAREKVVAELDQLFKEHFEAGWARGQALQNRPPALSPGMFSVVVRASTDRPRGTDTGQ